MDLCVSVRLSNGHFTTLLMIINILNQLNIHVINTQLQFETQNSKSFINLDDYPMLSKPIK
jgi:hypothetical protein